MLQRVPLSRMNGEVARQALVLVVEDEPQMRRFLVSTLAAHGYRSVHLGARSSARSRMSGLQPDLVVLDVGHPGIDGVGLTTRLRQWTSAPIVAVLNPSREEERAAVLEAGANDYLVKPFGTGDLLARVRVWLKQGARTAGPHGSPEAPTAHLRIDRERRCLIVDGNEVHITPLEYKLLENLARVGSNGATEEQILLTVWGPNDTPPVRYLRALIRQLRQKVEKDPARPRHLLSGPGERYSLRLG